MTMLAGKGHWVGTEDRQPAAYGRYRVICIQRGARTEADYLWNGSYWVTPKGSPSKGVQSWWEQTEATLPKSSEPAPAARTLTLADYEARIHLYKEQIGTGYIGIGRTLIEAKEAKVVPHGQWESWVTETTGLTPRQAQRCMQAATEIREGSAMARLEMSKALLLLGSGLDEEAREEIAGKAAEEGATVAALREEIRQTKLKLVQETGAATEIREAMKKALEERDQIEGQMREMDRAWKARLEEARESGYQRGSLDGQAEALRQAREEARDQLKAKQAEIDALRERADMNHKARINEIASWNEQKKEQNNRITGLQNELNKQKQYAEDLRKELDRKQEEAVPADYAKDREILLAAAADAEKRAADAEAELEALRAGGAGQPDPAWKVLKKALDIFMADCELLPINDVQGLLREEKKVRGYLNYLDAWVQATRKQMDGAVEAEGAVV
jgi:hypothetical protein